MVSPSGALAAAGISRSHGAQVVLADVDLVVPPQARLAAYEGTAILVTHDRRFLQAFGATRTIEL